jgi:hypothetical protein
MLMMREILSFSLLLLMLMLLLGVGILLRIVVVCTRPLELVGDSFCCGRRVLVACGALICPLLLVSPDPPLFHRCQLWWCVIKWRVLVVTFLCFDIAVHKSTRRDVILRVTSVASSVVLSASH